MNLDIINKIKIIKRTTPKADTIIKEELYEECSNSDAVLLKLEQLQHMYSADPAFEILHGLEDHLSISFRHLDTQEEISFYSED